MHILQKQTYEVAVILLQNKVNQLIKIRSNPQEMAEVQRERV